MASDSVLSRIRAHEDQATAALAPISPDMLLFTFRTGIEAFLEQKLTKEDAERVSRALVEPPFVSSVDEAYELAPFAFAAGFAV